MLFWLLLLVASSAARPIVVRVTQDGSFTFNGDVLTDIVLPSPDLFVFYLNKLDSAHRFRLAPASDPFTPLVAPYVAYYCNDTQCGPQGDVTEIMLDATGPIPPNFGFFSSTQIGTIRIQPPVGQVLPVSTVEAPTRVLINGTSRMLVLDSPGNYTFVFSVAMRMRALNFRITDQEDTRAPFDGIAYTCAFTVSTACGTSSQDVVALRMFVSEATPRNLWYSTVGDPALYPITVVVDSLTVPQNIKPRLYRATTQLNFVGNVNFPGAVPSLVVLSRGLTRGMRLPSTRATVTSLSPFSVTTVSATADEAAVAAFLMTQSNAQRWLASVSGRDVTISSFRQVVTTHISKEKADSVVFGFASAGGAVMLVLLYSLYKVR